MSNDVQDRDAAAVGAAEGDTSAAGGEQPAAPGTRVAAGSSAPGDFLADLLSSSYVREAPGTGAMRHGTEGWRSLETSFKASAHVNNSLLM